MYTPAKDDFGGCNVKTDKTDVYHLFESKRRYLAPIFQRGYVWTRTGQWQPLWEDILEQTEGVQAAAKRWCDAVTAEGSFGPWTFGMVRQPANTSDAVTAAAHGFRRA